MVNVTCSAEVPVLINEPSIFPVPLAGMPVTAVVLFRVQLKTMPAPFPIMGAMELPEQTDCTKGDTMAAEGLGLTKTELVTGVPLQPLKTGVMVNVTVTGELVVFTSAPVILPEPLAPIPVAKAALFLVQLKTVPTILLLILTAAIAAPEQTD